MTVDKQSDPFVTFSFVDKNCIGKTINPKNKREDSGWH